MIGTAVKFGLFGGLVASAAFVHFRGNVRHKFGRQLTDHSTFLAPYSAFVYLFSRVPARPFHDPAAFPELAPLAANWQTIREEGLRLLDEGMVRAARSYNDLGFNSFFRTGWKRFYLKWYDAPLASAERLCPKTVELLNAIPTVHGAMFTLLPPGARLQSHRDPFAGSLRYHLGLRTANSDECFIEVDGERRSWRDGEAMVFDETFIHYAENKTDVNRLILFCDVERPLRGRIPTAINRFVINHLVKATATENVPGEKIGFANRAFATIYQGRLAAKRLKKWNRKVYYGLKYATVAGVVALVVLA
ncbi:MAG TPA: aspartyl/asparaginyl beta-hydroxylase domain-containing protein [Acetobacteraceae bacterium]|nr:aspartyl/asparaginyl beta-hydroxylase domain-containing protein [Acetobacteraceae bacterium]